MFADSIGAITRRPAERDEREERSSATFGVMR